MAQRPGSKRDASSVPHGAGGTPQSKRRRLGRQEPEESGDWDDLEFTQQDLENLDVIASQAMGGGDAEGEASTSRQGGGGGQIDTEQTQELEPVSLSRSSFAERDQSSVFQAPAPGATLRLKNRSSTSSNSDSSVYPQSSASFRNTPSSEVSTAAGSLTSSSARSLSGQSSGEVTTGVEAGRYSSGQSSVQNGAGSSSVAITQLREDLRKKELEAQQARSEVYAKDGEVKFLKDSLHKQEAELERLRAEREERKDAEEQRQKEREKELKQEVERLQAQVQFKAQDILQLQQRCRTLETKVTQQTSSPSEPQPSTSAGGATSSQTTRSPEKSPKVRRVDLRPVRTPEKGAFPSLQSFMSPTAATGDGAQSVGTMTEGESSQSAPFADRGRERHRRFRLNVPCVRGRLSGPQLVSQLLHCSCNKSGEVEDGGIVALLQTLPTRHDLMGLKYERDSATSRLSPVKSKARRSSSPGTQGPKQAHTTTNKAIVAQEHYLQAVQGLRQLIDTPATKPTPPKPGPSVSARGAVLLLPMLNDYLHHYIDILTSREAAPESPNVTSGSNKSSSCETGSSLESLTSSLEVLLQQGAEYANTVETLTLCALRVLNALVSVCQDVRSVLVMSRILGGGVGVTAANGGGGDTSSSTVEETDQEKENPNESGMEGDDERSTVSSKGSSFIISPSGSLTSPSGKLDGLHLLHKLVRLASPSQESSGFKVPVVEAALDVLISLVVNLPSADVERLHLIVLRGVLAECLQVEQEAAGITLRALHLFSCLARSTAILPFLCTKDDSCTLLNIHLVLTRLLSTSGGKQELQPLLLHIITKVIDSMSSVVSFHRNGVPILTDNNCRCSGQIIPSLVHSMFYLLRDYQLSVSDDVFRILRKGVLLLHEISLRDPNYQQRHGAVDLYYCTLMSGLTRSYKARDDVPAVEASALEDLWEELDESDAGSQDSDREEPMVTDS